MPDIRVFFVTNRNYQPENTRLVFGKHFNVDGVAGLRFGTANFSGDAAKPVLGEIMVYAETKPDPKTDEKPQTSVETDFPKVGSSDFLTDLKQVMSGGDDTLVYVHGFNVDFVEALTAGARLGMNLAAKDRPTNIVIFTWPSDGDMVPWMSYYSDREDARASGPAVARAFLKLLDFVTSLKEKDYCNRSVHLLAHSMGNYVLRNALQALIAKDPKSLVRLFDQIILAAADEDDDTFEFDYKMRLLPRIGRFVTVYFNPRDKALLISDTTKGNPDRLGSDGPRLIDLIPKKIVLVDCRIAKSVGDKITDHSYYLNSEALRRDIAAVVSGLDETPFPNRAYVPEKRVYRLEAEFPG